MKKFDIKWLLILVLVVVLAFGLVACNKDKGNTTPDEPDQGDDSGGGGSGGDTNGATPAQFFAELWKASKSLGAEEVDPQNDKIKIAVAGDMEYSSNSVAPGSTNIGLDAGLVLDLKAANADTPSLGDSALKLQFYDKTAKPIQNWLTVWYFFKAGEESKIYFQVQDEYFVLSFDAYWNAQFTTLLGELLNKDDFDFLTSSKNLTPFTTLMDVVNSIAESGGSDWSLDSLIVGDTVDGQTTSLLGLFGLNLGELLSNNIVKKALKLKDSDLQGNVSLETVLTKAAAVVLDKKFVTKEVKGNVTYYKAGKLGSAIGFVSGLIDNVLDNLTISLEFGTDGTKFVDGFTIGIKGNAKMENVDLKINITKMEIKKETSEAKTALELPTSGFKTNVEFNVAGEMNLDDGVVKIHPNDVEIGFGTYSIKFNGSVDLVGAEAENKTAAELQIISGKLTNGSPMLTATYKNNTLSIKVDPTNAQAAAIMKAGLPALADLIKEYSYGAKAELPFKIFYDMADEVLQKAFEDYPDCTILNTSFKGIELTGVDIAVLAKGAFYALFQNVATKIDSEKALNSTNVLDLVTFGKDDATKDKAYKIGGNYYNKAQYAWSLKIDTLVNAVLKAISYDATSNNYTLGFSNIADLFLGTDKVAGIFKDSKVQGYSEATCTTEKDSTAVTKPADVNEIMALFMCTNDGLLKDLTIHGIIPLCNADGTISTKYIGSGDGQYATTQAAAAAGYYYVSGKMIKKSEALAIWNYICGDGTTKLNILGNGGTYTYYKDLDENAKVRDTEAHYLENSFIQWFFNFIDGSSVLTGATGSISDKITKLAGTGSRIAIDLNKETGCFGAHIALNGKTCEGTFDYAFKGTNTAYAPTFDASLGDVAANKVSIELDDDFYTLFKAAYGQGYETRATNDFGINNAIYYLAEEVTVTNGKVTSFTLNEDHIVIVLTDASHLTVFDGDEITECTYTVGNDGSITVTNGSNPPFVVDVYGNAFKLACVRASS